MKQKGESSGKSDFEWSFKLDLKTTRKVLFYKSPSHKLSLLSQNATQTETILALESS